MREEAQKSAEVRRVWEASDDGLRHMAMTDVLRLDDALRGEDVSVAELRRLYCGSCVGLPTG